MHRYIPGTSPPFLERPLAIERRGEERIGEARRGEERRGEDSTPSLSMARTARSSIERIGEALRWEASLHREACLHDTPVDTS